ncbi:uncharacterized protein MONBRDRAFT_36592 [Monosiga brevicollis MX1]|uniref:Uncharacterized protein n=1 Tax=Monosiga brevicollis TaxID=81824 RepID=A9UWB1_MONBE|nr:uncharacterized protein MONBRDRAFT_36592 [Monosiga brevicollis MX1]EDQ90532.1 predicted protein [Monosiga brevicollis MX1]|eukprot:XP_001744583.1 hypothetical protein [Monosiga brevicollis MX1]
MATATTTTTWWSSSNNGSNGNISTTAAPSDRTDADAMTLISKILLIGLAAAIALALIIVVGFAIARFMGRRRRQFVVPLYDVTAEATSHQQTSLHNDEQADRPSLKSVGSGDSAICVAWDAPTVQIVMTTPQPTDEPTLVPPLPRLMRVSNNADHSSSTEDSS